MIISKPWRSLKSIADTQTQTSTLGELPHSSIRNLNSFWFFPLQIGLLGASRKQMYWKKNWKKELDNLPASALFDVCVQHLESIGN
jgi:hypothetical protein